ncbi:MAG TPA: FRG domain-containing protein [Flavisolibacter sp.]|jgi:hypothetical protein|nr:FRG domain-containing protein [Flavisolibacter sp.]
METYDYTCIRLTDWHHYKSIIRRFSENWAFRGQADASWILNNAIERTDFIQLHKGIEVEFLAEFQRGARNYLTRDETPEHLIEWLALMQHHGAPTRLLDLTKSPFIAAYFAFEQTLVTKDNYVAIWCLNVNHLKSRALQALHEDFGNDFKASGNRIHEAVFDRIFHENNRCLVFPVEPFGMNRRYSLQQSIFVSTGISHQPLMKQLLFLGDSLGRSVVKLEIPAACKKEALRELQQMNLNRASLFPDLDGYAASLRLRYESLKSAEEILHQQIDRLEDSTFNFIP